MKEIKGIGKTTTILIIGACILSVALPGSYVLYHHTFTPDTVFSLDSLLLKR